MKNRFRLYVAFESCKYELKIFEINDINNTTWELALIDKKSLDIVESREFETFGGVCFDSLLVMDRYMVKPYLFGSRRGGQSKSKIKRAASKKNGKLGGRPNS